MRFVVDDQDPSRPALPRGCALIRVRARISPGGWYRLRSCEVQCQAGFLRCPSPAGSEVIPSQKDCQSFLRLFGNPKSSKSEKSLHSTAKTLAIRTPGSKAIESVNRQFVRCKVFSGDRSGPSKPVAYPWDGHNRHSALRSAGEIKSKRSETKEFSQPIPVILWEAYSDYVWCGRTFWCRSHLSNVEGRLSGRRMLH